MRVFFYTILFSLLTFNPLFAGEKYRYIVDKDGNGDFTSIQAAIDACKCFPDQPIQIFVKAGVYKEKIVVPSINTHITITGESAEKTIVTYNDFFDEIKRGRNSTFYTYTLKVEANEFCLENITIENSAGSVGQAIALSVEGDRCIFRNCRFIGNQDTVFAGGENCRQYFTNCYIEGTTDFIFGVSTAIFDNCTIHCKANSYITAAGTPQNKKYGFVFRNCSITAPETIKNAYLGRPWRDYAKVVFLFCDLGNHIQPNGWANWDRTNWDKTAYFAEYKNTSNGTEINARVPWSKILKKGDLKNYTTKRIFNYKDRWLPK